MIPLAFRFAGRELRSGVAGFRIFLACLAIGVTAIAAAGSTAEAFRRGLAAQAGEILGGDLAISREQALFTPVERARIERLGQTAYAVGTRAMAEASSGERRLVELRGVGGNYPLAGVVELSGAPSLADALKVEGGVPGAAVEQALLDRLGLRLGDRFLVGQQPFVARAVLLGEPDRLSRGFALGPRVLTRREAVAAGGFLEPGALFTETVRVALPPGRDVRAAARELRKAVPDREARIRSRLDAAPGLRRMIDRLEYFLGFIGLASLVAGGLGVYGAVSSFLDGRRPAIAALKALGAEARLIRNLYLIQIGVLALAGVAIGLVVGALAPMVLGWAVRDQLPVPALFDLYPEPLIRAAGFGLLAAAAFALTPLARARRTSPATLFRREIAGRFAFSIELAAAMIAAAALAALAVLTAPTPLAAAILVGGTAAGFLVLWALGAGAALAAGRMRGAASGPLRIALANLAGPGSAARTAAPAIGLGVALLAAVVLIQANLVRQVAEIAPQSAPALVFTDIPGDDAPAFDRAVTQAFGRKLSADDYLRAPFVTGRITHVRGVPVRRLDLQDERWAFDNDISMAAIGPEPPAANVLEGRWWPRGYAGPPRVALDVDVAKAARIKVGDRLTLSILGRDIEATVAVIRDVEIGSFGASFVVVVDPHALAGANLRHVAIAKATKAEEARAVRALGSGFPEVNVISVREQLEAATELFGRLTLAVRGAAGVAGVAGLLVLAGAIAARAQARAREAAILKVLGASRGQLLAAYVLEYGAVGLVAGLTGVALGYAAAWPVVVKAFSMDWSPEWTAVAALVGGAAALAGMGGLAAAAHALARRPAAALRAR